MMLPPLALFDSPLARALSVALVHFLWQGLAIAAMVALLLQLARPRDARLRYAICVVALAAMAAVPLSTFLWVVAWQVPQFHEDLTASSLPAIANLPAASPASDLLLRAEPYLLACWFGGVMVFATRLLLGVLGAARLRRTVLPLPAKIAAIAAPLGEQARLSALQIVFISREISDAMAVGLVRPLILIPASWLTEMPLSVLEAAIAHEMAHLVRYDLWVNWFQRIVETLLFYHPAVWWLTSRVRTERELCADELAVAMTGKRLQYVQALERIAAERRADIRPLLAAFMKGEPNMQLLHRVRKLLGQPTADDARLWPAGIVALALPLALWALAASGSAVGAQDERDEPTRSTIKRQRDREEDRDATPVRKSRREEAAEDGKRSTTETRVERYVRRKDGEEPREVERRTVLLDGKPVTVVELGVQDERRATGSDRRIDELAVLVKRLSAQVERLQDEVAQLRSGKQAASKAPLDRKPIVELSEAPKPRARLKSDAEQAIEQKIIESRGSADGERRLKKEADEQANRARAEEQRQLAEKKRQLAEQAAKEIAQNKDRIRKEVDEAVRRKIEAAREKAEAEVQELEKKLQKLKELKDKPALEGVELEFELKKALRDQQALIK